MGRRVGSVNTLTDLSKKLLPAQVNAGGAFSVAFTHTRIYGSTQQNYGTLQVHREANQLRLHLRVDGDLHTLTIPQAEANNPVARIEKWSDDCANGRLERAA